MYCRYFEHKDYGTLKMFYERRDLPCPEWGDLPQIGIIVEGCAALFMYMTDGPFVLLENAITDPKADLKLRHAALAYAIQQLTRKAKKMGFQQVLGFTQVASMVRLVKQLEWTEDDKPYTMVSKNIS